MTPSTTVQIAIGFLVGAALAALGLVLGGSPSPDDGAVGTTTTTVQTEQGAVYVQPGETVLGPSVLIPTGLEVTGTELALQYDLVPLAPPVYGVQIDLDTIPTFWRPSEGAALAAPETWTLITTDGATISGTTANTRSRAARFRVPEGFTTDQVDGIWIETWRMRIPVGYDITLRRDDTSPIPLDVDSSVALRTVLDQSENTIVQVIVDTPLDAFASRGSGFAGFEDLPQIYGLGPDWTAIGPLLDSSGVDGEGLQLTNEGDPLGDTIELEARTTDWVVFDGPIVVDVTALREAS